MRVRGDIIDISDARIVFDMSRFPTEIGIALEEYNPFDTASKRFPRIALCPVKAPFARMLETGTSRMFRGSKSIAETVVLLVPSEIGVSKTFCGVRCVVAGVALIKGEEFCRFSVAEDSPWPDESAVPDAVYQAAATLGDQIMDSIAGSQRVRDTIAAGRNSGGTFPTAEKWTFSAISDGGFSGSVVIDVGSWDMARVQLWARNQIERTSLAKLGAKSMENYRVVYDGETRETEGLMPIKFHVYPYRGLEIPEFDSMTRKGLCRVDISYLGISESEGYDHAVAFIERILADQGVVKTAGQDTKSAQYRFNGYRSSENGTIIEVPFELVN